MSKENEKLQEEKSSEARAFTSDLKSRQSLRATFRLTKRLGQDRLFTLCPDPGKIRVKSNPAQLARWVRVDIRHSSVF
jgi:hypothetical protein